MASLHELFTYNKITELPDINPGVSELKYIKSIISRDRSVDKKVARTELAFIYFTLSKKHFASYSLKKRQAVIIDRLDLPKGWEPDEKITLAIDMLRNETISLAEEVYRSNLEALRTSLNVMDNLRENTELTLQKLTDTLTGKLVLSKDDVAQRKEYAKDLRDDISYILDVTTKIPKSINEIQVALKKVQEEEQDNKLLQSKTSNAFEQNPNRWQKSGGV